MSTLDNITKEKQRLNEELARVDAQRERLSSQLSELEATERVLARYSKGPTSRKTASVQATKATAPGRSGRLQRAAAAKAAGGKRSQLSRASVSNQPVLGALGLQCLQSLTGGLQVVALPDAAHAGGRDGQAATPEFVGHAHLAVGRLLGSERDHGVLDRLDRDHGLRSRQFRSFNPQPEPPAKIRLQKAQKCSFGATRRRPAGG